MHLVSNHISFATTRANLVTQVQIEVLLLAELVIVH